MSNELKRTYVPFTEWKEKSKQTEYTEKTPLLRPDGRLIAKGWASKTDRVHRKNAVIGC